MFTEDGRLRITDRKKDLFKLSTGKYVMPQPIENRLTTHPLVEQAVVVGSDFKYPTALVFPDHEALKAFARSRGIPGSVDVEELVRREDVRQHFKQLVETANEGMDHWSRVKRFKLMTQPLTTESELLTPTLKVRRGKVHERFAEEIESMYLDSGATDHVVVEALEDREPH